MSNRPVLSKKVISSVPILHTVRRKFSGGMIMLAHGQKCHGGKGSVGVPRFVCGGCPHLHIILDGHYHVCGRRLSLMRRLRSGNEVIMVHPRGPVRISHVRASVGGLASLCRRKCTYTGGVFRRGQVLRGWAFNRGGIFCA